MKKLTFLVFAVMALCSCKNNLNNELKKTDSLLSVSSMTDSLVALFDSDTAHSRFAEMKQEIDFIGEKMMVLPENRKHRAAVSDYANLYKGFRRVFKTLGEIKKENEINKLQLQALKSDLGNHLLSNEETATYLTEEMNAVTQVSDKLREQTEKYLHLCSKREELHPLVITVTDSLKKMKNIP